jgi:hypothetical protein
MECLYFKGIKNIEELVDRNRVSKSTKSNLTVTTLYLKCKKFLSLFQLMKWNSI